MKIAWLDELLPQRMVSPRTQVAWLLFFALFPLAYLGGILLEHAAEAPARIAGGQNRAESIRKAEAFAASKGYAVADWHQYAIVETRDKPMVYYAESKQRDAAAVSAVAPAREVQVLFRSPDQKREFRVYLSLAGQVTGFDFGRSTARNGSLSSDIANVQVHSNTTVEPSDDDAASKRADSVSNADAEAIARRAIKADATLSKLVELGAAKVTANADDPLRKEVSWDAVPAGLRGVTLHITVSVRGREVVAQHAQTNVNEERAVKKRALPIFLDTLYGFFLTFGAAYALFRYAKRTLQKEVSHGRTLLVGALFSVSYSVLAYSLGVDQIATRVSGDVFAKIGIVSYVASGVTLALLGLLVGIAYGSGEGEVREAYPGKLTSLDALLAGRIASRNVASSFLFGTAAAGWLLLFQQACSYFLRSDVVAIRGDVLWYTFARYPFVTLLLGRQYDSLLIAVAGLLLPASFLLRRDLRKQRRFAFLIFFALCSVLRDAAAYPTEASILLATVVLTAALLLPFFAFDSLAATVSLSVLAFVTELVRLAAVIPAWTPLAWFVGGLSTAALAIATYLALRGRPVREEEVRPLYAKNLAERMAMQAEILAAREAQLRLLPQSAPTLPGVQLAACCLPARGVGGDFYDFFPLDANRVGIFVAQGGDDGLASALRIALAKGLLMHASQQSHTPTQIILRLEASIQELLEDGGGGISFAYGLMDTRRNLLNYARVGASPGLVVYRADGKLTASSQLERSVAEAGRLTSAQPIYEGAAQTNVGDFLIFFTEGVKSLRTRRFGKREYSWLDVLVHELAKPEEGLQDSLVSALGRYQNQATEDLTAVVMRVVQSQAFPEEVVA